MKLFDYDVYDHSLWWIKYFLSLLHFEIFFGDCTVIVFLSFVIKIVLLHAFMFLTQTYLSFLSSVFLFLKLATSTWSSAECLSYIWESCVVKSDTETKQNNRSQNYIFTGFSAKFETRVLVKTPFVCCTEIAFIIHKMLTKHFGCTRCIHLYIGIIIWEYIHYKIIFDIKISHKNLNKILSKHPLYKYLSSCK